MRRLAAGLESNSLPTDLRKYNGRSPEKSLSVDAFMAYVYFHMVAWNPIYWNPIH